MEVTYRSIGTVHSPFRQTAGMPIQPSRAQGADGSLELEAELWPGLRDLDGFSHLILVTHLHRVGAMQLEVVPFLDTQPRGIFATRAPARPNPIAISVLRIRAVEPGRVLVSDLDLLDGTPILDLKPYVPEFDARTDARIGWYATAARKDQVVESDARFAGDS
jgi:tRNA-Thr(GGU) m(6)t(6)A37 methyltransferase TsaA